MSEKKVGKRLLTWVLVLVMTLSLLPLNVLAANYSAENPVPEGTELAKGDTYTLDTDDASQLPEAPEGLRWDGPESIKGDQIICGKNEHQHDSNCYEWEWFLIFYRKLVCNKEEHTHSDYCYNHTYKWTLVDENAITASNTWRRWWPVYWTLSKSGGIDANDAIESVTAGENVAYTNGSLGSAEALAGTTATLGDAVDAGGFTITTKPGYYVTAARVVCGNYTGCGVSNDLVPTGQTKNNYSNTINIRFDQDSNDLNFDHLSASDVNLPKNYPTSKPTDGKYYNELSDGWNTNTLYPYYFLIQVAQDPSTYSVSYSWGDQTLISKAPDSSTQLKRNESYEVLAPSDEAIAEAAEKNLAFAGWKYNDSDMTYQFGESFSVSENVALTAQWTQLYTVSYDLDGGNWKDGETVETANYPENAPVSVTSNEPERSDYKFEGWEITAPEEGKPTLQNGKFTMPAANVTLTAQWELIEAPEPALVTLTANSKTFKYDGQPHDGSPYSCDDLGLLPGHTVESVDYTCEPQTNVGTYDIKLNNAKIVDADGKDVTALYQITYNYGKLIIDPCDVTVTIKGNTGTYEYDGTEKTVEGYTAKIDNDLYTEADFKLVDSQAKIRATVPDTYQMGLTPENFENTNRNFNVTFVVKPDGKLTIKNRPITITADDVTVKYDGQPHGENGYRITMGSLVDGHAATVTISGSKTDAGEYEELLVPSGTKIVDAKGKDVTSYYDISYEDGKLTIAKRDVTLTSASASKPYDGTALTKDTVTVGGDDFANGEGATYNVTGSQTEVGKSDNEFTYELNANTKASNYNITMYKGELVITAADSVAYKVEHYKQNLDGSYNNTPNDIDPLSGTAGTLTAAAAKDYPGFTPGTVTQEKIKSDGTTTIKIRYTRNSYTLTINYVYRDGSKAAESHIETILYGKDYSVTSPKISGYTADKLVVSGTMPADNRTVTVTYTKNGGHHPRPKPTVEIEDDDALGLNTTDHFAYIVGYGNGEVRPQNNITRAEVATIFFRLLTDDVRDENLTKTNRYSDVTRADWYNTAVSTLSSMGIITGYPDGTFRPNAAITRAEFAAISARFDSNGDKTTAKFSDIATHWAKDEISIAYNNGWINGYPNGTFGPQRDITRAETMTLVNRVLNRQPETEDDLLPNMTVWTDNANPNAWYYLAVQEATNSHYYKFKTNSKYEKWTELRETRDWTQLEK